MARDPQETRIRALIVPDSTYWILGTIAKGVARFNPWMDATIISGSVLEKIADEDPDFFDRFDIVHFLCPYSSKRWLDRLRDRLPVVTSHHHVTEWKAVSHNIDGDAIVAGSNEWVDDIVSRGADRSRVVCVPYGVDSDLFVPASLDEKREIRRRLDLPANGPVVGFFAKRMSNDDDRKGIDVFSEAMKALRARMDGAAVLIVGPGWQEMVSDFRRLGIRCAWFPFLEKLEDVAPLYRALDFYWVTARVEGGPVPLLEAMSSGVCCLSTPVGLAREILENGRNGILLPMNDPEAFVAETVRLWSDPDERLSMAKAARHTIRSRMHMGRTLLRFATAYDRAFANFASRTGRSVPDSVELVDVAPRDGSGDGEIALHGLGALERNRVAMLEALDWSEHLLLYRGQRKAALRLLAKAWRLQPNSTEPLRILLRRFLPVPIVRRIVVLKHAVASRLKAGAPVPAAKR